MLQQIKHFSFLLQITSAAIQFFSVRCAKEEKHNNKITTVFLAFHRLCSPLASVRPNTWLTYSECVLCSCFKMMILLWKKIFLFIPCLLLIPFEASSRSVCFSIHIHTRCWNTHHTDDERQKKRGELFICECVQKINKYWLYAKRYLNSGCLFRARPLFGYKYNVRVYRCDSKPKWKCASMLRFFLPIRFSSSFFLCTSANTWLMSAQQQ